MKKCSNHPALIALDLMNSYPDFTRVSTFATKAYSGTIDRVIGEEWNLDALNLAIKMLRNIKHGRQTAEQSYRYAHSNFEDRFKGEAYFKKAMLEAYNRKQEFIDKVNSWDFEEYPEEVEIEAVPADSPGAKIIFDEEEAELDKAEESIKNECPTIRVTSTDSATEGLEYKLYSYQMNVTSTGTDNEERFVYWKSTDTNEY